MQAKEFIRAACVGQASPVRSILPKKKQLRKQMTAKEKSKNYQKRKKEIYAQFAERQFPTALDNPGELYVQHYYLLRDL